MIQLFKNIKQKFGKNSTTNKFEQLFLYIFSMLLDLKWKGNLTLIKNNQKKLTPLIRYQNVYGNIFYENPYNFKGLL